MIWWGVCLILVRVFGASRIGAGKEGVLFYVETGWDTPVMIVGWGGLFVHRFKMEMVLCAGHKRTVSG